MGLPGARAADDADGLPGHGGEGDAVEGLLPGAGVGEVHVLKGDGGNGAVGSGGDVLSGLRDGGGCVEDGVDPGQAGQGPGQEDDQVGQLHQLHQDLRHVVDQGDDLPLGQVPRVTCRPPNQRTAMIPRLMST